MVRAWFPSGTQLLLSTPCSWRDEHFVLFVLCRLEFPSLLLYYYNSCFNCMILFLRETKVLRVNGEQLEWQDIRYVFLHSVTLEANFSLSFRALFYSNSSRLNCFQAFHSPLFKFKACCNLWLLLANRCFWLGGLALFQVLPMEFFRCILSSFFNICRDTLDFQADRV